MKRKVFVDGDKIDVIQIGTMNYRGNRIMTSRGEGTCPFGSPVTRHEVRIQDHMSLKRYIVETTFIKQSMTDTVGNIWVADLNVIESGLTSLLLEKSKPLSDYISNYR